LFDEKVFVCGAVRFCGNNIGCEEVYYYGEMICIMDGIMLEVLSGVLIFEV